MTEEERAANITLRIATAAGLHDPAFEPAGKQLLFESLDEFRDYYTFLDRFNDER